MDDDGDGYEPFDMDEYRRQKDREERRKRRYSDDGPAKIEPSLASDFHGRDIPPREWIVPGWIPERNVTMLSGDGGLGKSLLAMQLAIACATGTPWLGLNVKRCNVLYIACEDDTDEIQRRIADICRQNEWVDELDLENLHFQSRVGEDNSLITAGRYDEPGDATALYYDLFDVVEDRGIGLTILDSLHDLFAGNENNRIQARRFIGLLRKKCLETGSTDLLLAHPSAAGMAEGSGRSGSTAWHNAVRARMYLIESDEDESDQNERLLSKKKANYAGRGEPVKLVWESGAFRPQGASIVDNIERKKKEKEAQGAFLACLDVWLETKRPASWSANARTYAPRVFSTMKESRGVNVKQLERAMETLFAKKKIQIGALTTGYRQKRESIVRTPELALDG